MGNGNRTPALRYVVVVLAFVAWLLAGHDLPSSPRVGIGVETPPDPVIAAAGDIACKPGVAPTATECHHQQTSDLLVGAGLTAVLALGDQQYDKGQYDNFLDSYDPTWGRVKPITYPAPGNHEYGTPGADGYFRYFGAAAGDPAKGYYSFDIGAWHLVALNSNCVAVGGCGVGSPQEQWLRADLASHPVACTLAYWHHPRFSSSSNHGSSIEMQPFWQALYDYGADVVLSAHDHTYERFGPQTAAGVGDPVRGIRSFVVGTGGRSLYGLGSRLPNSELFHNQTFGVLKLTLHASGYDWSFVPEAGKTFTDGGTDACHASGPLTADFSASPTSGNAPLTVRFADLSSGSPSGWEWDFDADGTIDSTAQTPTFTYGSPGSYSVRLTVTRPGSTPDVEEKVGYIGVGSGSPPVATQPTEDAYVKEASPGSIFNSGVLQIRHPANSSASSEQWTYLKFDTSMAGPAVLRLAVTQGASTSNFGDVYDVADGWTESTLRWTGRPPLGAVLDDSHSYAGGWVEWEVGSLPAGTHSFAVANTSSATLAFASSEHGATASRPELVVTPAAGAPPEAPTDLQATAGDRRVELTWSPAGGAATYNVKRSMTAGGPYQPIATGVTGTSYADTTVANGTTYHYVVSAVNASGESPNSAAASATPSGSGGGGGPLVFSPVADAYVKQASPSATFVTLADLQVRKATSNVHTYLKFDVAGLTGAPTAARLRLCVTNPSPAAGPARTASNFASDGVTPWSESMTWNTRPPITGSADLSSIGAVAAGSCYEWDLGGSITGNGTHSFVLIGGSSDHAHFSSRQGVSPPQLIVTP